MNIVLYYTVLRNQTTPNQDVPVQSEVGHRETISDPAKKVLYYEALRNVVKKRETTLGKQSTQVQQEGERSVEEQTETETKQSDELTQTLDNILSGLTSAHRELVIYSMQQLLTLLEDDVVSAQLKSLADFNSVEQILEFVSLGDDQLSLLRTQIMNSIRGPLDARVKEFELGGISYTIREQSFSEADLGWKIWPACEVLVDLISQNKIQFGDSEILELGCGTGFPGIVCSKMGAKYVTLSDYHPNVVENALHNIKANGREGKMTAIILDWFDVVANLTPVEKQYEVIIAADFIYDVKVAEIFHKVILALLKRTRASRFYATLPEPSKRYGIDVFEKNMEEAGFICDRLIIPNNEGYTHTFYKYRYNFDS